MAKAVATAASTALPPFARIDAPMSAAMSDEETTTPLVEATPRLGADCDERPAGITRSSATRAAQVFMAGSLHPAQPSATIAASETQPDTRRGRWRRSMSAG